MSGGTGNDTYIVGSTRDHAIEGAHQGVDTVRSTVTFTLGVNVEKLMLTGSKAISGTGNTLANTLTGNSGANVLRGAGGNDTHGFRILDRLRSSLPNVRSLLMDHETLQAHQAHWTTEPAPSIAPLDHLTTVEASLYDDLRFDRLGRAVRLEQERVSLSHAGARIR